MTKTIVVSDEIYNELKELKKKWNLSFSEVIKKLLENKFNTVSDLIKFVEKFGKVEVEKVRKNIWKDLEEKVEELWKSA